MGKYKKPKQQLHHEFLYLNHEAILNALSAFEAGKVDEIILKTSESSDGGVEGTVGAGPAKVRGGKKREASIQEELVRSRTWFSAFDSWHKFLRDNDAIGTFDEWDYEVREELDVGDTIEFSADVELAPLHKVLTAFFAFAEGTGTKDSIFPMKAEEVKEIKKQARMMNRWIVGKDGSANLSVYMHPGGVRDPRLLGRLDEKYMVGSLDQVEGRYTVVAQVDAVMGHGQQESIIRILRDSALTQIELETVETAMGHLIEPSAALGVSLSEADLTFTYPVVLLRPIAVYR